MLRTRLVTAAVLVPVVGYLVYIGGLPFLALVVLVMTLAEIEFCRLVSLAGFHPSPVFGVGTLWLFLLDAQFPALGLLQPVLALVLLGSLAWQLFHRRETPVADWSLTLTGGLYVGACGACLIRLRSLPPNGDGLWWTLMALPAIMAADTGAYFFGRLWGRHKLAPRLSPGKTWEGYLAGVVFGAVVTALLASLWPRWAAEGTMINTGRGLVLGLLIAILAPLGDLAVSMIKRRAGVKDTGNIVPGHGGALDRVDSILWASVIGYCYVLWCVPRV